MFLTLTVHDEDARSLQETVVDESVCADLAGVIRAGFVVAMPAKLPGLTAAR